MCGICISNTKWISKNVVHIYVNFCIKTIVTREIHCPIILDFFSMKVSATRENLLFEEMLHDDEKKDISWLFKEKRLILMSKKFFFGKTNVTCMSTKKVDWKYQHICFSKRFLIFHFLQFSKERCQHSGRNWLILTLVILLLLLLFLKPLFYWP